MRSRCCLPAVLMLALLSFQRPSAGVEIVPRQALESLGLQLYWQAEMPLPPGDLVQRVVVLDDALYVLTMRNHVCAVHAPTGVVRWAREVAPEGQTVRGPTHSPTYAVFTTTTSVRLFDRRTGRVYGEPRRIAGYVIEVRGDLADVNVGAIHGIETGMTLRVRRTDEIGAEGTPPMARFRVITVRDREATGRMLDVDPTNTPRPGDRVFGEATVPIEEFGVPFSPASAAVADRDLLYFGAANQRFYALSIRHRYRIWELLTSRTISAAPILRGEHLYLAGQDGAVIKISASDRARVWPASARTEGPIFAPPAVSDAAVFAASSDRSLYAFDAKTGRRLWRERFDAELLTSPIVHQDTVYQYVPRAGLIAMAADSGEQRWTLPAGLLMLTRVGASVYAACGGWGDSANLIEQATLAEVDAVTGKPRRIEEIGAVSFVAATHNPAAIYLADRLGRVVCARSGGEPHLKPAELSQAFRDEVAAAAVAEAARRQEAERQAQRAVRDAQARDPFASRSTAPPAVGSGLVPPAPEAAAPAEAAPTTEAEGAEERPMDAEETPSGDEGEAEDTPKSDDESDANDEADKSEDDDNG